MATDEDPEAPGSRLTLLIGLIVAELASAMAFGRVYQGTRVTLQLCLATLLATALAAVLVRQNVLLVTLVSAAALFITVGLIVFPDTTHFWLPTMRTVRAAGTALRDVGRDANITAAPALPLKSLLLAGLTATWTAAFAAHSLAFRARSPLLALTPLASLLAFAGVVVEDGARPGYVLLFLLGALVLLFGDAMRRLGQWGPITAWRGRRRFAARTGTTARGAWRVAAGTLGVALFLPWLLPGFTSGALLDLGQGQARGFSLNPIDDIRPRLIQNPDIVAFTIKADHPAYWRTNTLDVFDGTTWKPSDATFGHAEPIPNGGTLAPPSDAPLAGATDLVFLHQQIHFVHLSQPWLPAAPNPVVVNLSDGSPKYDPVTGTLTLGSDLTREGADLSVISELVVPTPSELAQVPSLQATGDAYTRLPGNLPKEIPTLARQLTAAARTPYGKILLLQQTMKSWTYDQHVKPDISSDALLKFLLVTHRGYCQQYAGAMAVLLRALGYPARVAVGFTSGLYDAHTGRWRVTFADAHTWVEVRFPGFGWLAFDPTPTRSNPTIARYAAPSPLNISQLTSGPPVSAGTGDTTTLKNRVACQAHRSACIIQREPGEQRLGAPGSFLTGNRLPRYRPKASWHTKALVAAGAAAGLIVLLLPVFKAARRRIARRRGHGTGARILSAYGVVLDAAADVGFGKRPWETLEEYRARLTGSVPFSNGDFDDLTALAQRAAYAGGSVAPAEEPRARALARRASREIRRAAGPIRTLVGAYRIGRSSDA